MSTETLVELVNKDTDGDGILDWEEKLWGTDPTKTETTPGIPDEEAIAKIKAENDAKGGNANDSTSTEENLTQTDKFSRELLSTLLTLSQNGTVDQTTIDSLGAALSEKIQNPVVRKVYSALGINVIQDDSDQAVIDYLKTFDDIHKKYPDLNYGVLDVLQEFVVGDQDVNLDALKKLDPIIEQNSKIIVALTKMNVPPSMANSHLEIINSLERLGENAEDIRVFDTDPIVSLGGITQYDKNTTLLESSLSNLTNVVRSKLNN